METITISLDSSLIHHATMRAKSHHRTPPEQITHWATIGRMMEDNPDLSYEFICQLIAAKEEAKSGAVSAYELG